MERMMIYQRVGSMGTRPHGNKELDNTAVGLEGMPGVI